MLLRDDEAAATVLLSEVPAVGAVARQELQVMGEYSKEFKGLVEFVLKRALHVRGTLPSHKHEEGGPGVPDEDWREVSFMFRLLCHCL